VLFTSKVCKTEKK